MIGIAAIAIMFFICLVTQWQNSVWALEDEPSEFQEGLWKIKS